MSRKLILAFMAAGAFTALAIRSPRSDAPLAVASVVVVEAAATPPPRLDTYGDPLPNGAVSRIGANRFRASGHLYSLVFTPDAASIVGATENCVYKWDAKSGREVTRTSFTLPKPADQTLYPRVLGLSPDGRRVGGAYWTWEVGTVEPVVTIPSPEHGYIAMSDDGSRGITAGGKLWNLNESKMVADLGEPIHAARFLPDVAELAVIRARGLQFHNAATGEFLREVELEGLGKGEVFSKFALASDRKLAAIAARAGSGNTIRVWNLSTGKLVHSLFMNGNGVEVIAFSPDGTRIAGAGQEDVWLFELANGTPLRRHRLGFPLGSSLCFSPDGSVFAAAGYNGVHLFDGHTGALRHPVPGWSSDHVQFRLSADGRRIVTIRETRDTKATSELRTWDTATGQLLAEPTFSIPAMNDLSSDGSIVAAVTNEQTIQVWDVPSRALRCEIREIRRSIGHLWLSADGRHVTVVSNEPDRQWSTWDSRDGKHIATFPGVIGGDEYYNPVHHKLIRYNRPEKCLQVIDMSSRVLHRMEYDDGYLGECIWPPDRLVPLVRTRFAPGWRRWDLVTGKTVASHEMPDYAAAKPMPFPVGGFIFLPDGNRFLTGSMKDELELWDLATGKRLASWQTGDSADRIVLSADGRRPATSANGTVLIQDLERIAR